MKNLIKQTFFLALALFILPMLAVGSSNLTTRTHKVENFTKIEASSVFKVSFKIGPLAPIIIEAEDFAHDKIKVSVENGELELSSDNLYNLRHDIKVTITAPSLKAIDFSGASAFVAMDPLPADHFEIEASGASNVSVNLEVASTSLDVNGAAKVTLRGKANRLKGVVSGAAKVFGEKLQAGNATLEVSGAGMAELTVSGNLDAEASGAGNIRYSGNPQLRSHISGAGSIRKKD